jgi:hypothetical protein
MVATLQVKCEPIPKPPISPRTETETLSMMSHLSRAPQKWVDPIPTPVDVGEVFDCNATVKMDKAPSPQQVDRQGWLAPFAQ